MSKVTFEYTVEEAQRLLVQHFSSNPATDDIEVIISAPTVAPQPTLDLVPIQILNLLLVGKVDDAINYANDLYATTMSMYEVKEWIDSLQNRFFKPVDLKVDVDTPARFNTVPMSVINAVSEDRLGDARNLAAKHFNFSATQAKDYVYNLREAYFMYFHKTMTKRNG